MGAERNRAERQRISNLRRDILAGGNARTDTQSFRRENVAQFAIAIFNKSDASRAVRIVFDPEHFSRHAALAPFEIDLAVMLFVAAADVARGQPAENISAATFLLRLEQRLLRGCLGDFIEGGQLLESQNRSEWTKTFQGHRLNEIDFLALLQSDDRLLPARLAAVGTAHARPFAFVIAGIN